MKAANALHMWCPFMKGTQHFNGHETCAVDQCMMWEPDHERIDLTLGRDELPPDDGTEWHNRGPISDCGKWTATFWTGYKKKDTGDCGLKSKEQGCSYPS